MLKCTMVSPTQQRTEDELTGIFLVSVEGELGILTGHLPIVLKIKDNSLLRLKKNVGELRIVLGQDSFLRFKNNAALILTKQFKDKKEY